MNWTGSFKGAGMEPLDLDNDSALFLLRSDDFDDDSVKLLRYA